MCQLAVIFKRLLLYNSVSMWICLSFGLKWTPCVESGIVRKRLELGLDQRVCVKGTEPFPASPLTIRQHLKTWVCPQTIAADLSRDDIFICHRPKVLNTFPPGAEGERKKNNWKSGTASLAVVLDRDPPLLSYCLLENWKQKKTIWPDLDRRIHGVALVSLMRPVILCALKSYYSGTLDVLDVFVIRVIVIFN